MTSKTTITFAHEQGIDPAGRVLRLFLDHAEDMILVMAGSGVGIEATVTVTDSAGQTATVASWSAPVPNEAQGKATA